MGVLEYGGVGVLEYGGMGVRMNIEHRISNIEHRSKARVDGPSRLQCSMLNVRCSMFEFRCFEKPELAHGARLNPEP